MALHLKTLEKDRCHDDIFNAWFATEDGVRVVWIHCKIKAGPRVELWTIETREGYRQLGYAKQAIALLAAHFGVEKLYITGGYTPKGWAALRHITERPSDAEHVTRPTFKDMDFVTDWEREAIS